MDHRDRPARWRVSSHSGHEDCVAVAHFGHIGVRDSKVADGPIVTLSPAAWRALLYGVRPR
ncbi:hypothetical protein B4N89_12090 [Embleya scabrispora]|uniref:DUF397 domain-containing protein n=1 Tax=Embleya scabrispora TaxID=159449 RepID=A0A1T3NXP3_9ACTN|nr:DUF397 domain-containing protein [Embleya scabrispora]OPC81588.1 hypothetical protein B4N89_12090 [Embleya scabrispora]